MDLHADRLLLAAGTLVAGIVLAVVVRWLLVRLLRRLLPRPGNAAQVSSASRGVFWFLFTAAVLVALSMLKPGLLASVPAQVVRWLPKLALALLFLWLGAFAAGLLGHLVQAGLEGVQAGSARLIGRLAYWTVLGLAILLAADQLGIETDILQKLVLTLLVIAGAAAALALGLGGRALAGNVVAGRYVDDRFSVGEEIEVDDFRGTIVDVGLASVTISQPDGRLVEIPHSYLLDRPVRRSGI
jgi:small-conductance mechanosensitive channel